MNHDNTLPHQQPSAATLRQLIEFDAERTTVLDNLISVAGVSVGDRCSDCHAHRIEHRPLTEEEAGAVAADISDYLLAVHTIEGDIGFDLDTLFAPSMAKQVGRLGASENWRTGGWLGRLAAVATDLALVNQHYNPSYETIGCGLLGCECES